MTRQLTTLTLCLLLASCTTHKAEPARPAFDSSRNPDLLSPDLYPNGVQPEKEPVVRYGRYTLVSTQPDAGQRDLMAQIIDVTIPSSMNPSVKDAMQYVMSRSGYSLCPAEAGHVNILYTRPLPAAQYKLGPMTLRNTLQVLSGPAWQVKVDEVARQVCFVLRPGYQLPPVPRPKPVQQLYAKPAAPTPAAVTQPSSTEKVSTLEPPVVVASVPTPAPITTSPAPTKKPEYTTVLPPSRTGQGWPLLFSSRGFGTDQASGLRREVHAAHSGHRGFHSTGQGAPFGGAESAADTGLVGRDGINPARHLGSLGQARTLDRPLGAAGSQLSDRSSSDLPRLLRGRGIRAVPAV